MARIRTIKPEFFRHDGLARLSPHHRLLFIGLWTLADREGRLADRPARVKAELFPYELTEKKVDEMLTDLADCEDHFIVRYEVDGGKYIQISNFAEHQRPHPRDPESKIPGIAGDSRGNPGNGHVGSSSSSIMHESDKSHAPLSNSPIVQESKSPKIPEGGLGETEAPSVPVARLAFPKSTTRSDYEQFYKLYPKTKRFDRNKLKVVWDSHGCDEFADQIIADVSERIRNGTWNKNGDYVPGAAKYLEQRQWESEDPEAAPPEDESTLTPQQRLLRQLRGQR